MLQNKLKNKCVHDKKLRWPILFQRFIDDGFGIMEGGKKDVIHGINQFNTLRKMIKIDKWSFGNHVEFMDLYIYKRNKFYDNGFLDFKIHQKEINRYMYIPYKSGHVSHTIKNYVLGEIKRYIRFNSLKLTFLKIRTKLFSRLRNRGFKKVWLRKTFRLVQYEDRSKLLNNSQKTLPDFQVVTETEAESLVVQDSERILRENGIPRLCFNPGFKEVLKENRLGTDILVPLDPLISGGGTISTGPSNFCVRNSKLTSSKNYLFLFRNQEEEQQQYQGQQQQHQKKRWDQKHHR